MKVGARHMDRGETVSSSRSYAWPSTRRTSRSLEHLRGKMENTEMVGNARRVKGYPVRGVCMNRGVHWRF